MATKSIFGIGTVVIDHVVVLPRYPERNTKSAVTKQWRQVGGPVPVALSVASFYGSGCSFAGRWGEDAAGREIELTLSGRKIDLSASKSDDSWTTGFAHVWTDESDGARTIAFSRGEFSEATSAEQDSWDAFSSCGILHLDGSSPSAALVAAQRMRDRDGIVVLDAGSKKPGMESLLPLVDVLVASDLFCNAWFGSKDVSLPDLLQLGADVVVRTLGEHGAVCFDGASETRVSPVEVNAVDTNGAGDIFCGGLLVGLSRGWSLERTMQFANYVAAHSCSHYGNSVWPAEAEVTAAIEGQGDLLE